MGHRQATDHGTDAHRPHEDPIGTRGLVERVPHQERKDGGEVEGEDSHDADGDEDIPNLLFAEGIAEARPQLSLRSASRPDRGELAGPHHRQCPNHGNVGRCVDEEARSDARGGDEDSGDARTNDPTGVHQHAVETHRVGQQLSTNHLLDEGLTSGVVEEVDHAEAERQHEDGRDMRATDQGQDPKGEGK